MIWQRRKPPGWLLCMTQGSGDSCGLRRHDGEAARQGLCVGLLEEAAIDGIPAIVIDPKGDLANLLLTFPQLRGEDLPLDQ